MGASAVRMTLVVAVGLVFGVAGVSFAQESNASSQGVVANEAAPSTMTEAAPVSPENAQPVVSSQSAAPDTSGSDASAPATSKDAMAPQWIWGEVVSVDKANKQVQIKHLDYDTYEEVTKVIQTDAGTLYENVGGISDLNPGDSVTVDFKMKDGAQVAELIVVDKNRAAVEPAAPVASQVASDSVVAASPDQLSVPAVAAQETAPAPDVLAPPVDSGAAAISAPGQESSVPQQQPPADPVPAEQGMDTASSPTAQN